MTRKVKILTNDYIPHIGKHGPILHPVALEETVIKQFQMMGFKIEYTDVPPAQPLKKKEEPIKIILPPKEPKIEPEVKVVVEEKPVEEVKPVEPELEFTVKEEEVIIERKKRR